MNQKKHVVYTHKVNYYETDKMGITHHSNYIRFMEEARMQFLKEIGYPMHRIEEEGLTSPVVSISCEYKSVTTYDDLIDIDICISKYTGVVLEFSYELRNKESGKTVGKAKSSHCFINEKGNPVAVKKYIPEMDKVLNSLV